uniref:Uncharacterized protein n=1 Tax=Octopus bimaculoides TaxID=37653 RepID=A0A0L8FUW5_OCTBM
MANSCGWYADIKMDKQTKYECVCTYFKWRLGWDGAYESFIHTYIHIQSYTFLLQTMKR